jgi:hypothetical protein
MPGRRPHGGDSDSPSGRPGRPHGGGSENVAAAHEAIEAEAQLGRPGAGGGRTPAEGDAGTAAAQNFVNNVVADPRSVAGRSAEDIAADFRAAGYDATVEHSTKKGTSGNAVQVRIQGHPDITNIQVHPGGGRHTPDGSPYWKISTSTAGKTWVIPGDFRGADDLGGNVVRYDE